MTINIHSILAKSVSRLLKPLIRLLLRQGIAYGTMAEWVRQTYVDAATEELKVQGQKPTITNISSITGLTRKETKRLCELDDTEADAANLRFNRAARVITGWKSDREFHNNKGQPADLLLDAPDYSSFALLVKRYSGDMTTVSMLEMLRKAGCIEVSDDRIRLIKDAYIPEGATASADKITILGNDVAELITTISHNLSAPADQLRFQRKVFHTALDSEHLATFKQLAAEQSQQLLEDLYQWLEQHQLPSNSQGDSHTVALGIYCHEQSNKRNSDHE
jgi:hypothetical protein